MKIRAIIFGSTGMVGKGLLFECLESNNVESVLVINRHTCNISHNKLKEIIHENLFDLSGLTNELVGYNTCFFCLGVSSAGLSEKDYHFSPEWWLRNVFHDNHGQGIPLFPQVKILIVEGYQT